MPDEALSKSPWVKHYGHIPASLSYSDGSLWEAVFVSAEKYPDTPALNYFGKTINYALLREKIACCAKAFKALGLGRNDKVTICLPNTPEAIISFYAINMIGAVANMIHPLSAENEIRRFVNGSQSKVIITINISAKKIERIINDTPLEKVIVVSPKDSMPLLLGVGYQVTKGRGVANIKHQKFISFRAFMRGADNFIGDYVVESKGDDLAAILYSGGTTGEAKGIMLSNLNFNALAVQSFTMCDCLAPQDRILSIMPIFHGFGLGICIHTALYYGTTAIILPQFDIKTFHKLILKYKPQVIAGVPTLYEAMMRNEKMGSVDLSILKCVISGGDSLSINTKEKVDAFLKRQGATVQIREGYGLTECVTGSCLNPISSAIIGSIGIPYPDTFYKIVKPGTHEELAFGEVGEICLSGPTVMLGYLDNEEETRRVLQRHEDGLTWLFTGDLGYMDADGYLYFKQRIKRMIITSGYNVYPQSIENIIDSHPDVLYSTVIGLPDEYRGQRVKAYVVLKSGVKATEAVKNSIRKYCTVNITKYAIPKEFEYRDSLPKTLVGKVDYRALELENITGKDEKKEIYE